MPKLIILCGTSSAGKSTLACQTVERFRYPEADVDETKVELFGSALKDHELNRQDWRRIYISTSNTRTIRFDALKDAPKPGVHRRRA